MPDILRVTTPLVNNNNQNVQPKANVDPTTAFQIQDTTKVIQPHNQSEILKQNTSLLEGENAPTLLLSLLKDPAVTVSYLKNIFLLEEIFKLLPANNQTVTREIEQMFDTLLMPADQLAPEMSRQEHASTMFKGELFDLLRQISSGKQASPEVQRAVANLLKSINNLSSKGDILDAVANSLSYLKENLSSSQDLSSRLENLISRFRAGGEKQELTNFPQLKAETLALLKDIEESILFSPKLSKIVSITTYNLSRYNDSMDFLQESAFRLRQLLTGPNRQQFITLMSECLKNLQSGKSVGLDNDLQDGPAASRVMDALVQIVTKQAGDKTINLAEEGRIERIIHSLLSSPCNFTPLLHFIVPAMFEDMRAFAEIWINPQSDEKDMPAGAGTGKHFLLVIDVESLGRFEAELFVHDNNNIIDFSLFCPPGYEGAYSDMMKNLPQAISATNYRFGNLRVEPLERSRSLMDVFKSLPYKRVGVDVKI